LLLPPGFKNCCGHGKNLSATSGSASGFPDFALASTACLFSILCIKTLRLPRLLHPFKKLPARFVPTFPITVPRAEAATSFPKVPKSTLKNLVLTSSSPTSPFLVSTFSPPSKLVSPSSILVGETSLSPN